MKWLLATRVLSFGYIIAVLGLSIAWVTKMDSFDTPPHVIANLALREIDDNYLYASSAAWKAVRREIAKSTASDRDAMYAFLAHQLASMRDSELHLVTPRQLAAVQRENEGNRLGVGLMEFSIDLVPSTGEARIVTPLVGSPAAISGLHPRDVIVAVNGKLTRELDHEQVLDSLRSTSAAELFIRRGKRNFHVHLSSSDAPLEPVTARSLWTATRNIAYLRITQFTAEAGAEARAAVPKTNRPSRRSNLRPRTGPDLQGTIRRLWADHPVRSSPDAGRANFQRHRLAARYSCSLSVRREIRSREH